MILRPAAINGGEQLGITFLNRNQFPRTLSSVATNPNWWYVQI